MRSLHGAGLIDAVDAFCERIAFSAEQTRRVFDCARALSLPVRLHGDQLSDQVSVPPPSSIPHEAPPISPTSPPPPLPTRAVHYGSHRPSLTSPPTPSHALPQGSAQLAASHGALSCDHCEHTSEEGASAMGKAGTVAVLLPASNLFMNDPKLPPVDAFRRNNVKMAVATNW